MAYDLTAFNAELAAVDGARSFTQSINPAWGENEWSVSGYAITAGSDTAVQHAASEALYQLGFRFWTPSKATRPGSLPSGGVTLPRQQFLYPHVKQFFNYGVGSATASADYALWTELQCFDDSRRPVGHAYPSIINAIEADDGFFTANPTYMTGTVGSAANSFNLDLTGADRTALINRVAAHIVPNLNEQKRHSIDPNDGSTWTSDEVFTFANEVAAVVAQSEPDVMLGLYGYAGHRTPVEFDCPRLYVDIARGFNDLGIGYLAMGKLWSQVVPEFGLRCYGDIAVWGGAFTHLQETFLDDFAEHAADGALGITMETSGNWTKNVIAKHHWMRHWRDGTTTYQDALSDAVDKLYGGDSRVADLFTYWSTQRGTSSIHGMVDAARIIEAMPDTDYRAEFERYMTVALTHEKLHGTRVEAFSGPYFTGLERNFRASKAMEAQSEFHHWAYVRFKGNANVINNGRPDLAYNANAHWDRYPDAYDRTDFLAALEDADQHLIKRPAELLDERLIVVDTQPYSGATVSEATSFKVDNVATFTYLGPGTVDVDFNDVGSADRSLTFGAGLHQFTISGQATVTWTGGLLFLSLFPTTRMNPDNDEGQAALHRWAYVPKIVAGKVGVEAGGNIRFHTAEGTFNIREARPPITQGFGHVDPRGIPSGVVMVDNVNTSGFHQFININPYVSPTPYKMLMPFDLAQREFPSMTFNGAGQVPTVLDLSDDTDGQSENTED